MDFRSQFQVSVHQGRNRKQLVTSHPWSSVESQVNPFTLSAQLIFFTPKLCKTPTLGMVPPSFKLGCFTPITANQEHSPKICLEVKPICKILHRDSVPR